MASPQDTDKKVRKLAGSEPKKGEELAQFQQGQNELLGINQQQQSLLQEQMYAARAQAAQTQTIAQAGEMGAMSAIGGGSQQLASQVSRMNPQTQATMAKYGVKPSTPRVQKQTSRSVQVTPQKVTVYNTTNTTTHNDVKVTQPAAHPVIVNSAQPKGDGIGTVAKFKTWMSNAFARQREENVIREKEYKRKEWSLSRSASRMMRGLEKLGKTFAERLDPRKITRGGFTTLQALGIFSAIKMVSDHWPTILEYLGKIVDGWKKLKEFIGWKDGRYNWEGSGLQTSLIKLFGGTPGQDKGVLSAMGKFFWDTSEGSKGILNLFFDKFQEFWKERAEAIGKIPWPGDNKLGDGGIGDWVGSLFGNLGQYLKDIFAALVSGKSVVSAIAQRNAMNNINSGMMSTHDEKGTHASSRSHHKNSANYNDISEIGYVDEQGNKKKIKAHIGDRAVFNRTGGNKQADLISSDIGKVEGSDNLALTNSEGATGRMSSFLEGAVGNHRVTELMYGLNRLQDRAEFDKKGVVIDSDFLRKIVSEYDLDMKKYAHTRKYKEVYMDRAEAEKYQKESTRGLFDHIKTGGALAIAGGLLGAAGGPAGIAIGSVLGGGIGHYLSERAGFAEARKLKEEDKYGDIVLVPEDYDTGDAPVISKGISRNYWTYQDFVNLKHDIQEKVGAKNDPTKEDNDLFGIMDHDFMNKILQYQAKKESEQAAELKAKQYEDAAKRARELASTSKSHGGSGRIDIEERSLDEAMLLANIRAAAQKTKAGTEVIPESEISAEFEKAKKAYQKDNNVTSGTFSHTPFGAARANTATYSIPTKGTGKKMSGTEEEFKQKAKEIREAEEERVRKEFINKAKSDEFNSWGENWILDQVDSKSTYTAPTKKDTSITGNNKNQLMDELVRRKGLEKYYDFKTHTFVTNPEELITQEQALEELNNLKVLPSTPSTSTIQYASVIPTGTNVNSDYLQKIKEQREKAAEEQKKILADLKVRGRQEEAEKNRDNAQKSIQEDLDKILEWQQNNPDADRNDFSGIGQIDFRDYRDRDENYRKKKGNESKDEDNQEEYVDNSSGDIASEDDDVTETSIWDGSRAQKSYNYVSEIVKDAVNTAIDWVNPSNKPGISDRMIHQISQFERGKNFGEEMTKDEELKGYMDAGSLSYGYGLKYHPKENKLMQDVKTEYSKEELDNLYLETLKNHSKEVDKWAGKNNITLTQNQKDAIVSATYNYGVDKFLNSEVGNMIASNPNDPNIPITWANLPSNPSRRKVEADWYGGDITGTGNLPTNSVIDWINNNVLGKHNTYTLGTFKDHGNNEISTDCSSAMYTAYKQTTGIEIGRNTAEQIKQGEFVHQGGVQQDSTVVDSGIIPDESKLVPGDLLFYRFGDATGKVDKSRDYGVGHVEMYIGDGMKIGTGSTKNVKPTPLTQLPQNTLSDGTKVPQVYIGAKRYASLGSGINSTNSTSSNGGGFGDIFSLIHDTAKDIFKNIGNAFDSLVDLRDYENKNPWEKIGSRGDTAIREFISDKAKYIPDIDKKLEDKNFNLAKELSDVDPEYEYSQSWDDNNVYALYKRKRKDSDKNNIKLDDIVKEEEDSKQSVVASDIVEEEEKGKDDNGWNEIPGDQLNSIVDELSDSEFGRNGKKKQDWLQGFTNAIQESDGNIISILNQFDRKHKYQVKDINGERVYLVKSKDEIDLGKLRENDLKALESFQTSIDIDKIEPSKFEGVEIGTSQSSAIADRVSDSKDKKLSTDDMLIASMERMCNATIDYNNITLTMLDTLEKKGNVTNVINSSKTVNNIKDNSMTEA